MQAAKTSISATATGLRNRCALVGVDHQWDLEVGVYNALRAAVRRPAIQRILASGKTAVVNVCIDPKAKIPKETDSALGVQNASGRPVDRGSLAHA